MSLQVGKRLRSQNSTCEVIVIRGTEGDSALMCAAAEMLEAGPAPEASAVNGGLAIEVGKRYVDDEAGLEVLCVKPGAGPLTLVGRELTIKAPKSLPASD
jgi:hypothetical protein